MENSNKEKQIEEMAKDIRNAEHWWFDENTLSFRLDEQKTAENIYAAGYRKQSEGEWLGLWDYECSVCKEYSEYKTDFCPRCGAKMKGGE